MTKKHDIIWIDETDSTNNEAARHIHELDNLSVLSARRQVSGRGQGDHVWLSEPDMNLTFTVVLKYNLPDDVCDEGLFPLFPAKDQKCISDITTASVLEFLSRHGIDGRIKLPNDILVDGKKICGILIEHSVRGRHLVHTIVGIGLNVKQRNFDVSIPNATSMALLTDEKKDPAHAEPDLRSYLEEFMEIFTHALQQRLLPDLLP